MVDLFRDIPQEVIDRTLQNIRENLDSINMYGGHVVVRHANIHPNALKMRITKEDIRYATSFQDAGIAGAVVRSVMRQYYEEQIQGWLVSRVNDFLGLTKTFQVPIGYGYKKGDDALYQKLTKARIVLLKDENTDWGFRVITGYPLF